jgi:hypothetical protein
MPETELSGAQANANQTDSPVNTLGKPDPANVRARDALASTIPPLSVPGSFSAIPLCRRRPVSPVRLR